MKRFLISILLLLTLVSGSSFAWDKHPTAALGHDQALVMEAGDHLGHDHGYDLLKADAHQDDHCSHGAAHLVGLFQASSLKTINIDNDFRAAAVVSLPSLYISPLLRPPIV